jgi:hypothetical protein
MVEIIKEEPNEDEEGPGYYQGDRMAFFVEKENPLITDEYNLIIEASKPKHTMQQLLGLSNK